MEFFAREEEIQNLREIRVKSHEFSKMTVVTGRRRVGKTELAKHALNDGVDKFVYLLITRQEEKPLCAGLQQEAIRAMVYTMNGDVEKGYEQKVKDRICELGLTYVDAASCRVGRDEDVASTDFIFTGALDDDKKWETYGRADLFVLPTYSENFGIVVAEALWAGVPYTKQRARSCPISVTPKRRTPRLLLTIR